MAQLSGVLIGQNLEHTGKLISYGHERTLQFLDGRHQPPEETAGGTIEVIAAK